ncbi:MAG: efflux transporter outer rane subunit [Herminiimonas sp.]|nr:efflux transporter outer rane subunit [Herminiimonas sp.]
MAGGVTALRHQASLPDYSADGENMKSIPVLASPGRSHSSAVNAALAGFCTVVICGCADVKITDYQRPDTPVKSSWTSNATSPVSAKETIAPDWWKEFRDPYLDELVSRAIAGNFDIKVLAARIQVANAQLGEARAGALPVFDVGGGASFDKTTTGQKLGKQFNLAAQVNWDIDVWGKVEKGVQAQSAEFRATEADWRAGYLNLVSTVSTTYFQILQLDEQIDEQERTLAKNQEILGIYDSMYKNGLLPNTQVLQQRAEINRLRNDMLELRRSRALADNALSTLMGIPAGDFKVPPGHLQQRVKLPPVPGGIPSVILERRPDIVAAEFRVLEAHNLVGQAKLAQLPSISLTGRGGTSSFALTDLLRSFTFGLLPSINFPGLDPNVRARVVTSEAQIKVAEQQYRKTVVDAFEEVENALVNLDAHKKQGVELRQQVDHLGVVSRQIEVQLKEGVVSQLELFETQRSLLTAQLALLANHQQVLSDTVTLYKALGGGWPVVNVANASQ